MAFGGFFLLRHSLPLLRRRRILRGVQGMAVHLERFSLKFGQQLHLTIASCLIGSLEAFAFAVPYNHALI